MGFTSFSFLSFSLSLPHQLWLSDPSFLLLVPWGSVWPALSISSISHPQPNQVTRGWVTYECQHWAGQEGMPVLSSGGLVQTLKLGSLQYQILRPHLKSPYFKYWRLMNSTPSFPALIHSFIHSPFLLFFLLVFFKLCVVSKSWIVKSLSWILLFLFIEIYLHTIKFILFRSIVWQGVTIVDYCKPPKSKFKTFLLPWILPSAPLLSAPSNCSFGGSWPDLEKKYKIENHF